MGDIDTFFWGFIFGAIGMAYFVYGKSQRDLRLIIIGILLCAFPYFVSGLITTLLIGAALTLAPLVIEGPQ